MAKKIKLFKDNYLKPFFHTSIGKFTVTKFIAFIFFILCLVDWLWLYFHAQNHYTVILSNAKLPASVIVTIVGFHHTIFIAALSVYKIGKIKKAE